MSDDAILVGDVGGTNVRLALARVEGGRISLSTIWKREGATFKSFEDALDVYLDETGAQPTGAALGLAGVVASDRVELINRGWTVDLAHVRKRLGGVRLVAVNDFIAMARAAPELDDEELEPIRSSGADPNGSAVVGGPGTGFGIAILRRTGSGWVVIGGEGGHQAFAPQTPLEWELAEAMRRRGAYVSNELVAAGAGFELTRDCLAEVMGLAPRAWSQADVIAEALKGDAFAAAFCRLRVATVMSALGNIALACNASGGVYVAGGVATRLAPWLDEPEALARFDKRGPHTALMEGMTIKLIESEAAPLLGVAHLWLDERARGWI
jgi:glucokinase